MSGRGLVILAVGLLAGVLVVQLPHWLQRDTAHPAPPIPLPVQSPACDAAREICTAADDQMRMALQFRGPVIGLQPFRVQLVAAGHEIREVQIEFTMAGMDMGQNRYRLLPEGNGWVGMVTLPVCTTGRSDWLATVRVTGQEDSWEAVFPFTMQAR